MCHRYSVQSVWGFPKMAAIIHAELKTNPIYEKNSAKVGIKN